MKKTRRGATVSFQDKTGKAQSISAEKVLIAVGRRPLTENIGLEKTKAKLERGFVHTNAYLETDEPQRLRHRRHRRRAAATRARRVDGRHHRRGPHGGQRRAAVRPQALPAATYCEPQIGSIGLTEKQAREAGYDVKTGKFPFLGNSKATILGQHEGFIKVVADAKYGEILGVHAIGPLATEIIAEPVAALGLEATLDDMAATIHAHPTVWEAMGDAFNSVRGLTINF